MFEAGSGDPAQKNLAGGVPTPACGGLFRAARWVWRCRNRCPRETDGLLRCFDFKCLFNQLRRFPYGCGGLESADWSSIVPSVEGRGDRLGIVA